MLEKIGDPGLSAALAGRSHLNVIVLFAQLGVRYGNQFRIFTASSVISARQQDGSE
ncbi:hypothetical protein ACNKHS_25245 [Shigella flexneri]